MLVLLDNANEDSDKENCQTVSRNVSVRSNRRLLGVIPTRTNVGQVLRELSICGASERKSLRDRKGGRAERGSSRIETANPSLASMTPTSTPLPLSVECAKERHTNESLTIHSTSTTTNQCLNTEEQQPTPQQESAPIEITKACTRLQEVLKMEDSGIEAPPPQRLETAIGGESDNESFDPDSPLPMSRAPRHSLLLSLTASPTRIGEASPSKSSTESSSPVRDDLVFIPEYHIITTPSRNRPARSSPGASVIKTPMSQAVPRHRDARTQRREQATLERQATISNKLSAASLTMSGLGAAAYGSSSTPYKVNSAGQKVTLTSNSARESNYRVPISQLDHMVTKSIAQNAVMANDKPTTLAIVHDVFDEPTKGKTTLHARSPPSRSEPVTESSIIHQNTSETVASRIPKSVVAPTQPVFRKPMISNLPVMKPSLSTFKSSTAQKPASNITSSLKAVRPEAASQAEPVKFATPSRGRAPSALAFRSPATFRVVSAGSTVKPIQARTASGTLLSSAAGVTRPVTPGKLLYRSVGASETATVTPRKNNHAGTITILSTSTSTTLVSMSLSYSVAVH